MEKIIAINEKQLTILTDALAKVKERFEAAADNNDIGRMYDHVSQMTQLSHSITEAIKADRESHLEKLVKDCTEAVDDLAEDLADLSIELIRSGEDVTL